MATSLKRRIIRAGSWHVIKRATKLIPVVGSIFAVGLAGYEIKKKGLIPGVVHVGLDVIPVLGATKNVIEIFTGDLIPDKQAPTPGPELPDDTAVETQISLSAESIGELADNYRTGSGQGPHGGSPDGVLDSDRVTRTVAISNAET